MAEGYIKLYRQIMDNQIWQTKPYSFGQAWAELIMLAAHTPTTIYTRSIPITLKRGEVGISIKVLANKWGWSRNKVNNFYTLLENQNMISFPTLCQKKDIKKDIKKLKLTTIISIVNYDSYQSQGHQNGHQKDIKKTSKGHQNSEDAIFDEPLQTPKNVKNVKKKNINIERISIGGVGGEKTTPPPSDGKSNGVPTGVSRELFYEYLAMRRKIKRPLLDSSHQRFFKKLLKVASECGDTPDEILEQSILNSWQGVFAIKDKPQIRQPEQVGAYRRI